MGGLLENTGVYGVGGAFLASDPAEATPGTVFNLTSRAAVGRGKGVGS
jgi:hypothetical protein